jgi:hypothetical protein
MNQMKEVLLLAATSLAASLMSMPAQADGISLGEPSYGGTGCPGGTASAVLSPDARSLSILFDAYTVEAMGQKRVDRKSCNVAIPVHVPQGLSISVVQVDYRGFNSLPQGALSSFNVEYFFAGQKGPKYQRNFSGPVTSDFLVQNPLQISAIVWSPCGADTILRTNSSMSVQTNSMGQQAQSSIDSIDIQAGVIYQLQWRSCQ